jgi:hypothetical protein
MQPFVIDVTRITRRGRRYSKSAPEWMVCSDFVLQMGAQMKRLDFVFHRTAVGFYEEQFIFERISLTILFKMVRQMDSSRRMTHKYRLSSRKK